MQDWQDIVKTALVGTERQGLPAFAQEASIGRLLGQLDAADRERALLRAAGVLACCRRAGYRVAMETSALPTSAVDDNLPRIRANAAQDLDRMLSGEFQEALPDWLAAVTAKRQRVPEEQLPALLELGRKKPALQGAITGVIGARGRWLADLKSEWKYATQHQLFADSPQQALFTTASPGNAGVPQAGEVEQCWQTGTREERLSLLVALRTSEPARACQLVTTTWAQDPAEDRALFLETFIRGLSLEDEPLLENALDDRRKEVRQQSAELLARLPGSQLCRRMIERARPMLTMASDHDGRPIIQVALPAGVDPSMLRDGIPPKPPQGSGEKTWWTMHILAAVPLGHWCDQFHLTPAAIVAMNRSEQWSETVLVGWTRALQRVPSREWATALLDCWTDQRRISAPTGLVRWTNQLSQSEVEARAIRLIQKNDFPMTSNHPVAGLLIDLRGTWGPDLTRAVLDRMSATLRAQPDQAGYVIHALENFAPLMSSEVAAERDALFQQLRTTDPYIQRRLERYSALAQFRLEILRRIEE